MTLNGAWLVARQEFRMRLRTGRWRWLLALWLVVVGAITILLDLTLVTGYGFQEDDSRRGVPLFGFLMFFVLGMMLVISPTLTSQTINGDRERGTLATLQVTKLRPLEITLGKLLAGWAVGLVALGLTLPFTGYAMARGGITIGRVAAVYAVVALLVGVVCAVSQMFSATVVRSISSALLSYLTVAALSVGTVIAFGLIAPLLEEFRVVTFPQSSETVTVSVTRYDKIWWLLAPNPFVIVADSAPQAPSRVVYSGDQIYVDDYDPLSSLGRSIRTLRLTPDPTQQTLQAEIERQRDAAPVWPTGLAIQLVLGVGSVAITTMRLRTPTRKLARGVRVA